MGRGQSSSVSVHVDMRLKNCFYGNQVTELDCVMDAVAAAELEGTAVDEHTKEAGGRESVEKKKIKRKKKYIMHYWNLLLFSFAWILCLCAGLSSSTSLTADMIVVGPNTTAVVVVVDKLCCSATCSQAVWPAASGRGGGGLDCVLGGHLCHDGEGHGHEEVPGQPLS